MPNCSAAVLSAIILIAPVAARAQWSSDPAVGTPISSNPLPVFAQVEGYPDSQGGAIFKWRNSATTTALSQAQRVDVLGQVLWGQGTPEFGGTSYDNTIAVPDGQGGLIAAWQDKVTTTDTGVFIQKFSGAGQPVWILPGLRASTDPNPSEYNFALTSDNAGGAIVTWGGDNNTSGIRRLAQRFNAEGARQWGAAGLVLSTVHELQYYDSAKAVTDGAGGIITAWAGNRGSDFLDSKVVAQRAAASGVLQWNPQGKIINDPQSDGRTIDMKSDGEGGAYILWNGDQYPQPENIFCQRINAAGSLLWTSAGVAVSTDTRTRISAVLEVDPDNNPLIGWIPIFDSPSQVAVQKLAKSDGTRLWGPAGKTVNVSTNGDASTVDIASDGLGGVIAVWAETRTGHKDIVAQRVNAQGDLAWQLGGVPVSSHPADQAYPAIVGLGSSGAIVAWSDSRNAGSQTPPNTDVYSAYLEPNGTLRAAPTAAQNWGLY